MRSHISPLKCHNLNFNEKGWPFISTCWEWWWFMSLTYVVFLVWSSSSKVVSLLVQNSEPFPCPDDLDTLGLMGWLLWLPQLAHCMLCNIWEDTDNWVSASDIDGECLSDWFLAALKQSSAYHGKHHILWFGWSNMGVLNSSVLLSLKYQLGFFVISSKLSTITKN